MLVKSIGIINIYSTNNQQNIQINVNGWRRVTGLPSGIIAEVNGLLKLTHLSFNLTKTISAKTVTTFMNEDVLPVEYCPVATLHSNIRQDDECSINFKGKITYYCSVALTNYNLQIDVTYKNKM